MSLYCHIFTTLICDEPLTLQAISMDWEYINRAMNVKLMIFVDLTVKIW